MLHLRFVLSSPMNVVVFLRICFCLIANGGFWLIRSCRWFTAVFHLPFHRPKKQQREACWESTSQIQVPCFNLVIDSERVLLINQ